MNKLFPILLFYWSLFAAPNSALTYQDFIKESHQLRMDQELKIYKKQQEFLSKFFKKKLTHLKEIAQLQQQMEWGNKEKNKKIAEQIAQKKRGFLIENRRIRQAFFKNELRLEIENFNLKMRQRKQAFNKKATISI